MGIEKRERWVGVGGKREGTAHGHAFDAVIAGAAAVVVERRIRGERVLTTSKAWHPASPMVSRCASEVEPLQGSHYARAMTPGAALARPCGPCIALPPATDVSGLRPGVGYLSGVGNLFGMGNLSGVGNLLRYGSVVVMAICATTMPTLGQRPPVRGAADAMTVVPSTTPGGGARTADEGVGTTGGGGSLPAGHPAMPGGMPPASGGAMDAMHGAMGGGMGGAASGAIRVNFSQGTKLGPVLGKDAVKVQLFAKGVSLKTYETAMDDKGVLELHDLPLDVAFQPIITVLHEGAEEQYVGPPVNKMQPMVEMDMKVYETTAEKPAWTIGLRDIDVVAVDLGAQGAGLQFTELLGGFNPSDRAWTGEAVGGTKRTMTMPLAAEATDVQLGPGFAEAGATVVEGAIVRGKTMLPGAAQYVFGYTIPPRGGKVTATFTAPADTTLFAMYFPAGVKVESISGLELATPGGTNAAQNRQLLKARAIKAGETVSVVFSGIKAPVAATKAATLPQTSDLHLPVPSTKPGSNP